jgi:transcriptional regulator with XRE-family HTH domain
VRRRSVREALDDLGRRIAEIRRAKGMTQHEVAEQVGMPMRDYQKIEGGIRNITMRTVVTLASALDVDVHDLFLPPATREPRRAGRPRDREVADSKPRKRA